MKHYRHNQDVSNLPNSLTKSWTFHLMEYTLLQKIEPRIKSGKLLVPAQRWMFMKFRYRNMCHPLQINVSQLVIHSSFKLASTDSEITVVPTSKYLCFPLVSSYGFPLTGYIPQETHNFRMTTTPRLRNAKSAQYWRVVRLVLQSFSWISRAFRKGISLNRKYMKTGLACLYSYIRSLE
jgi:hypothetical protein